MQSLQNTEAEPTPSHLHTILSHNMSGFFPNIADAMKNIEDTPSIINLQETHHFESSKKIIDSTGKYITHHCSGMDENRERGAPMGGIVTYIRADLPGKISSYCATKRFVVSTIGNVMNINCYLPQPQLYQTGEYKDCLSDIKRIHRCSLRRNFSPTSPPP